MCSIMGYCGPAPDMPAFEAGFERTKSRGRTTAGVVAFDDGVLAFHRLAIMGLEPSGMAALRAGRQPRGLQRRDLRL